MSRHVWVIPSILGGLCLLGILVCPPWIHQRQPDLGRHHAAIWSPPQVVWSQDFLEWVSAKVAELPQLEAELRKIEAEAKAAVEARRRAMGAGKPELPEWHADPDGHVPIDWDFELAEFPRKPGPEGRTMGGQALSDAQRLPGQREWRKEVKSRGGGDLVLSIRAATEWRDGKRDPSRDGILATAYRRVTGQALWEIWAWPVQASASRAIPPKWAGVWRVDLAVLGIECLAILVATALGFLATRAIRGRRTDAG